MVEDIIEDPLVEIDVDEPLLRPISHDILVMVIANVAGLGLVLLLFVAGKL